MKIKDDEFYEMREELDKMREDYNIIMKKL
jgi:hypothetical protein